MSNVKAMQTYQANIPNELVDQEFAFVSTKEDSQCYPLGVSHLLIVSIIIVQLNMWLG
jgi:hypothetical protein